MDYKDRIEQLQVTFTNRLEERLEELENTARDVVAATSAEEKQARLETMVALAHALAGSAGTFGFTVLGEAARRLETLCQLAPNDADAIGSLQTEMHGLLDFLRTTAADGPDKAMEIPAMPAQQTHHTARTTNLGSIILVEDDKEQSQILETVLTNFGFDVLTLNSPDKLEEALSEKTPVAVVMDIVIDQDRAAGLVAVKTLRKNGTLRCPVVFLTVRDDLDARLNAMRHGCDAYLVKPVNVLELVGTLRRLVGANEVAPYRVLVIDDDEDTAKFYRALLEEAGVLTDFATTPQDALEKLQETAPDVILMDVVMPYCSGLELAAVIRQTGNRLVDIPIIFISAGKSDDLRLLSVRAGGDDLFQKPVDGDLLVSSVLARADRSRAVSSLNKRHRASEDRFRALSQSAGDAIISINQQNLIVSWNEGARITFGYDDDEVIGFPVSQLIARDDLKSFMSNLWRSADEGGHRRLELTGMRKNNESFPLEISIASWEVGGEVYFTCIIRDITAQVRSAAELMVAKEAAEDANRSKSEFLTSMSHELRTPLNAILGFSQILAISKTEPLSEKQSQSVDHIVNGGNHLLRLVNDVLNMAKIEGGSTDLNIERVLPAKILGECMDLVANAAADRGIEISMPEPKENQVMVMADPVRLKQVLINLMSNAVKYNRDKGTIRVEFADPANGRLLIAVADTGLGIPKEKHEAVFRPFERLGAETTDIEGSGIGLAVTKKLVEIMDGEIGLDSEFGKGSRFWLSLPMPEEDQTGQSAQN